MFSWSTVSEVVFPSPDVSQDSDSDPQSEPQVRARRISGTRLRSTPVEDAPSQSPPVTVPSSAASRPAASRLPLRVLSESKLMIPNSRAG